MIKVGTSQDRNQAKELDALTAEFSKWSIQCTPKGSWVAKRKRYFAETLERIDKGFRFALISKSPEALRNDIIEQENLHSRYPDVPL